MTEQKEEKKLDFKSFETHPLKEVMSNAKLMEAKAKQLREFAMHYDLAKVLDKNRPEAPHIMIEAWQFAGFLCQLRGGSSGFDLIPDASVERYKTWAEIVDADGNIVANAESMCDRSEKNWKTTSSYAVASMGVTRAQGKAWRMVLGFLPLMAGFSATPWEEMVNLESDAGTYQPQRAANPNIKDATTIHGMTSDQFGNWVVSLLNREGVLAKVPDGDISAFVKSSMEKSGLKWDTAQKVQLEKAVMTQVDLLKKEDGIAEAEAAQEPEAEKPAVNLEDLETPEHGMTMDQFGVWTQGVMETVGLKITDMSPKGISQFVKLGLQHGKLDWYTATEEELKAAIRVYTDKVVKYAQDEAGTE